MEGDGRTVNLEKEDIDNQIVDDLDARNRNWVKIESLLGMQVIESGGNEKGDWIKYASGIQICSFLDTETTQVGDSNSDGAYFNNKVFDFPVPFSEVPIVTPTSHRTSYIQWAGVRDATTTTTDIYIMAHNSSARGYLGYIAIGRWK